MRAFVPLLAAVLLCPVVAAAGWVPAQEVVSRHWWSEYKPGVLDGSFSKSSYQSGETVLFRADGLTNAVQDVKVVVSVCSPNGEQCKKVHACTGIDREGGRGGRALQGVKLSEGIDRCTVVRGSPTNHCAAMMLCTMEYRPYEPGYALIEFKAPAEVRAGKVLQVVVIQQKTRLAWEPVVPTPILPCPDDATKGCKVGNEGGLVQICTRGIPPQCYGRLSSVLGMLRFLSPIGSARALSPAPGDDGTQAEANAFEAAGEDGQTYAVPFTSFEVPANEPVSRAAPFVLGAVALAGVAGLALLMLRSRGVAISIRVRKPKAP